MGKQLFAALVWIASIAIALFAGMQIGEGQASTDRTGQSSRTGPDEPAATNSPSRETRRDAGNAAESADNATPDSGSPRPSPSEIPTEEIELTLEGIESAEDLSDLFMRYARQKLHQGPEGHKTLFKKVNELMQNRDVQRFFRDERALMPLLYPWVQFGFENEKQVVNMMETLYRTAADEPQWYTGLDDDPLDLFTQGLAVMLPGMVDAERLAMFRGLVEQILKMDADSLPDALKKNVRNFQRNLEYWVGPLTPEEMLAQLQDPGVPDATKLELLRRIPPDQLRGYDVAGLIARSFERGDTSGLRVLGGLTLGGSDLVVLDRAYLAGVAGKSSQWWLVRQYLQSTGRTTWPQMKPLFEDGLRRGGETTKNLAQALTWMEEKPPADFVRRMIDSYELPAALVTQLKSVYKLE